MIRMTRKAFWNNTEIGPAAKIALAADPGETKLPHDYDDVATVQVTITDAAGADAADFV